MPQDIVLQTQKLKKYFGPVHAVEEVSLSVPRGQVYGFLGPNGAGKTTTIGMLLGLLHPTSGSIRLFGEPVTPGHTQPLRRVGALVGAPALIPYLTARQNLDLLARLSSGLPHQRYDQILEQVGLEQAADRRAGHFSTGMKQRLGIAMALLHQPELLILDEPTNGMDPAGMREIRIMLKELAGQGVTVFLSSHLLHEVEQVCDQIAVLNQGHVVAQGNVHQLLGKQAVVRLRVESPTQAVRVLEGLPGASHIQPNGAYVTLSGVTSQAAVAHLVANGIVPSEVSNPDSDLESLFLELTQEA